MANVRDSDTSLWLHNKLGTSNDSWTGGSICSQLNAEVLRNIKDCFPDLQTQVKLKLLLSFFHIPKRNVDEWKMELEEILEVAQVDSELWVSMLAEIMKTLPSTGSLNTNIGESENRRIFSDLYNDLRKLVKKQNELGLLPLECHYLNKTALASVVGQQPAPPKHFTLKRKPKSAALRAELMQKSADAQSNLKKSTAPTVPVRSRGMPRKMTDTTPLKGLPSRVLSGGFRSPINNALSRPTLPRTPAGRKDGGIKLLDITEQPLGFAQAKKRKRMQEMEEAKRASEMNAAAAAAAGAGAAAGVGVGGASTPDYAVGLTALNPPTPTTQPPPPLYTPAVTAPAPGTDHSTSVLQTTPITQTINTTPSIATLPTQPTQQIQSVIQIRPAAQQQMATPAATSTSAPVAPPPAAPNTAAPNKGLSLTRNQIIKAQEMFQNANKVTRPEKALILGFMAGSRVNPYPHLGNIVYVKLSENEENIKQPDGSVVRTIVQTLVQMNYNTGEWQLISKYLEVEDELGNPPLSSTTTAAT